MIHNLAGDTVSSALDLKRCRLQSLIEYKQSYRMPFGVTNGVAAFQLSRDKLIDDKKL